MSKKQFLLKKKVNGDQQNAIAYGTTCGAKNNAID
jgi:hypothetical protein